MQPTKGVIPPKTWEVKFNQTKIRKVNAVKKTKTGGLVLNFEKVQLHFLNW